MALSGTACVVLNRKDVLFAAHAKVPSRAPHRVDPTKRENPASTEVRFTASENVTLREILPAGTTDPFVGETARTLGDVPSTRNG